MNLFSKIKRKIYKIFRPQWGEILMLHSVVEKHNPTSKNAQWEISGDFLEKTILEYRAKDYVFVTLDQVREQLIKGKSFRKKFICFTFDDGFADNYELAYPILKKYNCPFAIYVTTSFIDNLASAHWYEESKKMLSKEQLSALSNDSLCTIGAHALTHPHLTEVDAETQKREILESKVLLEEWTGKPVLHFAYPHGDYNQKLMTLTEECGFQTAVLCNGDYVRKNQSLFALKRKILVEK